LKEKEGAWKIKMTGMGAQREDEKKKTGIKAGYEGQEREGGMIQNG